MIPWKRMRSVASYRTECQDGRLRLQVERRKVHPKVPDVHPLPGAL